MDFFVVEETLAENIERLDRAQANIRHCLPAYEQRCSELIGEIGKCDSVSEAETYFNSLLEIQSRLATLLFKHRFDIGPKLETLIREFDRLYYPYIKRSWFDKFKNGAKWPESI